MGEEIEDGAFSRCGYGMALAADVLSRSFFGHAYPACTRKLPFRLSRFLNDAPRCGVLRQVDIEYQFRHVKLQEHLAESYRRTEGKGLALSASSGR
ncbi:hypothetical protein FB566_0238 [Stackebrandtia endophytica]|uniref:Uncharacterized protein n=1 Tax=Stackebrandtia endophytica TaxID=1496996 RepID=A0A543AQ91_9ACTN|nr:hypothetical protein FB566_0238 [Stackebrandtia endophytica]